MNTHYIVQTACAKMPSSCWGRYRRVAVLRVPVTMSQAPSIRDYPRLGVKVIYTWERLFEGISDRCAYARALRDAEATAERLNEADEARSA